MDERVRDRDLDEQLRLEAQPARVVDRTDGDHRERAHVDHRVEAQKADAEDVRSEGKSDQADDRADDDGQTASRRCRAYVALALAVGRIRPEPLEGEASDERGRQPGHEECDAEAGKREKGNLHRGEGQPTRD